MKSLRSFIRHTLYNVSSDLIVQSGFVLHVGRLDRAPYRTSSLNKSLSILQPFSSLVNTSYWLILCTLSVAGMGLALSFSLPALVSYCIITGMSFLVMLGSTLFMVQIYTIIQTQTPPHLVGKVMAALIALALCGQPIGQALYGVLFDRFSTSPQVVHFGASLSAFLSSSMLDISLNTWRNNSDKRYHTGKRLLHLLSDKSSSPLVRKGRKSVRCELQKSRRTLFYGSNVFTPKTK